MIDQLIIGDRASFDDFGASLSTRVIGQPKKKSIRETVPYSNKTYDFSAIDGEVYWEDRELEYSFEMTAPTPEKLEDMKIAFSSWIMNIFEDEIHDPFIPEYHFKGTFEEIDFEDDEGLDKTTAKVKFTAYPYKIANHKRVFEGEVPTGMAGSLLIINESSHPVTPTINSEKILYLRLNGKNYTAGIGETYDETLKLPVGVYEISVSTDEMGGKFSISFYEEVF